MKTVKAWAFVERATGRIAKMEKGALCIAKTKNEFCLPGLYFKIVRVEIREIKPKKKGA